MEIFRVTGRLFQWKLGCMEHSIQSELHFTWELCERANTVARISRQWVFRSITIWVRALMAVVQ